MRARWILPVAMLVCALTLPLAAASETATGAIGHNELGFGITAAANTRAFMGAPSFDSGWVTLAQDEAKTLTHSLGGLNTDPYFVDMQYQGGESGINQRYYGGADFGAKTTVGAADDRVGAYWRSLTTSSIVVYRRPEDTYASQVRIRIWVDPAPTYDSGWITLSQGATATTLTHNLGGNPDNYVVDMQYKAVGVDGVNQRYFGGRDFGTRPAPGTAANDRVGAYWRTLTQTAISVFRRAEDIYASQVRIRIWVRPRPDYDSGWVSLSQNQSSTLAHNLGGNPANYVVYMLQKSPAADGVNQRHYGGADYGTLPPAGGVVDDRVGSYWRSLSGSGIVVYRRPEDPYASQVRVRIWEYHKVFLPLTVR